MKKQIITLGLTGCLMLGGVAGAKEIKTVEIPLVSRSSTKTYMNYTAITKKSSPQYQLIHNSGKIEICDDGFLRDSDGYVGVALGSALGKIGDRFHITLSTGKILKAIKLDEKANEDTVDNFYDSDDGSVIEFVIDKSKPYMQNNKGENGLIFNGNFRHEGGLAGTITKIERIVE